MKKIYLLLLIVASFSMAAQAQSIVNIPDANFKAYLLGLTALNTDANPTEISVAEAAAFTGIIICGNKNIADLTGIEAFTALTQLFCNSNQLAALDVSHNTALRNLDCHSNQLTVLDVSHNTALRGLYCTDNPLVALDVSNNTALTFLNCSYDQLATLDVSNNTVLNTLDCSFNGLSALDVSHNTALGGLYCNNNRLTVLDISHNTALGSLYCNSNQLTALDVSGNTALTSLNCSSNRLTALDLTGLNSLITFQGNAQAPPVFALTGSGNSYTANISLNSPANLASGITYVGNTLYSNSNAIISSPFTIQTNKPGFEVSGTLLFRYQKEELLPVTFGNISAILKDGQLLINWSTLTERNNDRFEIEVSTDGNHFVKIGEIKTKAENGNSTATIDYSFNKEISGVSGLLGISLFVLAIGFAKRKKRSLLLIASGLLLIAFFATCNKKEMPLQTEKGGKVFVRIKQINQDGSFEYSKVVQAVKD